MSATISLMGHFARLLDFKGREDRASFWPFAAAVFVIVMVIGMIIFVPIMAHDMTAMQQYAAQHPDQSTITSAPGQYSISIQGDHPAFSDGGSMALYLVVSFGLSIILYAAAVTRRLHDRGKSGWWGLMPLPFILYSTIMIPRVFASPVENMPLFFSIFFSNMLYIVTLIVLIVLLAGASDPASNGYDAGG